MDQAFLSDLDNTDTSASDSDVEPTRHEKTTRPRREPLEQDDNGPDSSADYEPAAVASRRSASVKRKRMSRRETDCYLESLGMTKLQIEFSRLYKSLIRKGQHAEDKIKKAYNLRKHLTKADTREMAKRKKAKLATDPPVASLCDSAASSNESEMKHAGASSAPKIAFPSAAAAAATTSPAKSFRYPTTSVSSSGRYSAQMDDASKASSVADSPYENPDAIVSPRNSSYGGDTSRRSSSHAFPCVAAATSPVRSARCPRSRNQLPAKTASSKLSSAPPRTATACAVREESAQLVTLAKAKDVLKAGQSGRFFVRVRRFSAWVRSEHTQLFRLNASRVGTRRPQLCTPAHREQELLDLESNTRVGYRRGGRRDVGRILLPRGWSCFTCISAHVK